jgi:pyrroline-5-carboxylate reductase
VGEWWRLCVFREGLTVGIIGAGRLGSALIRGLLSCCSGRLRVVASARSPEKIRLARELGAEAVRDNRYLVRSSDLVIVCVKPSQLAAVAEEVAGLVRGKPVVSVAAGVRLSTLERLFPGAHLFRAMPNINAAIGQSTTAITPHERASGVDLVVSVFSLLGRVYLVPEELLDAWTLLAASGPALVAEIVEAFTMAGVAMGLPRDLAYDVALDVIASTALHLRRRYRYPQELRDQVVTPGGTTIEALKALEERAVRAAIVEAMVRGVEKARELGRLVETLLVPRS